MSPDGADQICFTFQQSGRCMNASTIPILFLQRNYGPESLPIEGDMFPATVSHVNALFWNRECLMEERIICRSKLDATHM